MIFYEVRRAVGGYGIVPSRNVLDLSRVQIENEERSMKRSEAEECIYFIDYKDSDSIFGAARDV